MWRDSIRNIVVIFQTKILRIVGFYVRRSASEREIFGHNSDHLIFATHQFNITITRAQNNNFGKQTRMELDIYLNMSHCRNVSTMSLWQWVFVNVYFSVRQH